MTLRSIAQTDISDLLLIEQAVSVVPWTSEVFKTCFESGYKGFVITHEKKVIGFVIISLTVDECHILNLAVARDYQRQGFGHRLLKHVLTFVKQQGVGIVYLEVRRSNTRAINLYKKMHFLLIGERKDYYPTVAGREDALIYAVSLHKA
jgi:[ribosomal protein S18]-alanine N-acetyltransferase